MSSKILSLPTPKDYLGFDVGEDRKLADWPDLLEYYRALDGSSDRIIVNEIGRSTEDNPFIVATISSPENLSRLNEFQEVQRLLADPRLIDTDSEVDTLVNAGKAIVAVTCSIHATEVGATQMAPQLVHNLLTGTDKDTLQILDEVILLLVPSLNPDGLIKVKHWYDNTLGTKHEGIFPPFLYHKYTGHDNNRDWFMFTQAETKLVVEKMLNMWHPQILFDLHQTRPTGMRMILPPFVDPIGPNVDPLIQSQLSAIGTSMANDLIASGKAGVAVNAVYDAYSPNRAYQHYHSGIRILSEVAGVRIASPVHIEKSQLKPNRDENPTRRSWNHPMPWQGGRWSLGDIVEYDHDAVMACLRYAARNRESCLRIFHRIGANSTSARNRSHAFLIPDYQRDANTASELLGILNTAQVEVHKASEPFIADGHHHPAGTRVVFTNQPYGAFAKTMLETRAYPDMREYPGGPPKAPYDVTAHSLPVQMGVDVVEIQSPFNVNTDLLKSVENISGRVRQRANESAAYLLRPDTNSASHAVNALLKQGARVSWAREPLRVEHVDYPPGTFIIEHDAKVTKAVSDLSIEHGLVIDSTATVPEIARYTLRMPRIGLYRSFVATAEEGWTRFVFDEYGFQHEEVTDATLNTGNLNDRFDAIVLPHQAVRHLYNGQNAAYYPAEYAGGIGDKGAEQLKKFVVQGGTVFAWDGAARYLIQHLDLKVTNSLAALTRNEFYAPGTLLRLLLDTNHPIGFGMSDPAAAMFVNGPAFDVQEGRVIGKFPLHNPLLSGWLIGGEKLFGKAGLVSVPMGDGEVILLAFRSHFRAQTRGTYKILFNSMYYSVARSGS